MTELRKLCSALQLLHMSAGKVLRWRVVIHSVTYVVGAVAAAAVLAAEVARSTTCGSTVDTGGETACVNLTAHGSPGGEGRHV